MDMDQVRQRDLLITFLVGCLSKKKFLAFCNFIPHDMRLVVNLQRWGIVKRWAKDGCHKDTCVNKPCQQKPRYGVCVDLLGDFYAG